MYYIQNEKKDVLDGPFYDLATAKAYAKFFMMRHQINKNDFMSFPNIKVVPFCPEPDDTCYNLITIDWTRLYKLDPLFTLFHPDDQKEYVRNLDTFARYYQNTRNKPFSFTL